jgi:hypothetical protein
VFISPQVLLFLEMRFSIYYRNVLRGSLATPVFFLMHRPSCHYIIQAVKVAWGIQGQM